MLMVDPVAVAVLPWLAAPVPPDVAAAGEPAAPADVVAEAVTGATVPDVLELAAPAAVVTGV
jgi:hypothetical protein